MDPILNGVPHHWQGTDDSTPDGCTMYCTELLGIPTTYVLRDDRVIGRIEGSRNQQVGYTGRTLKGGQFVGGGDFYTLAQRIAEQATETED